MKRVIITLLMSAFSLATGAQAGDVGGVGSGGGDTTDPNPATPEDVVSGAQYYAGKAAMVWFQRQEQYFTLLQSAPDQEKSPFKPIFRGPRSISEVLAGTTIELEMSKPCFDADGRERDGSIHASQPSAICISPFKMAPKLNDINVYPETVALIIHEVSHLAGADESQADEIQKQALWAFSRMDLPGLDADISQLADPDSEIQDLIYDLVKLNIRRDTDLLSEHYANVLMRLGGDMQRMSYINLKKYQLYRANYSRIYQIRDYLCSVDPKRDESSRESCRENIKRAFGDQTKITARKWRIHSGGSDPGAIYDEVLMEKIVNEDFLNREIEQLGNFLFTIQDDLLKLDLFNMTLRRIP